MYCGLRAQTVPVCMYQQQPSWHDDLHTLHHRVWFLVLLIQGAHDEWTVMPGRPATLTKLWQLENHDQEVHCTPQKRTFLASKFTNGQDWEWPHMMFQTQTSSWYSPPRSEKGKKGRMSWTWCSSQPLTYRQSSTRRSGAKHLATWPRKSVTLF